MSCRVLKRGVEDIVLKFIVKLAKDLNCTKIVGEYIATAKNSIVRDFYPKLGFEKLELEKLVANDPILPLARDGEAYLLNLPDYSETKTFITYEVK
jgi:predicted enzyme involved in methoxymalonyl-ACP biosynthesis